jgi:hypothetical protein
VKALADGLALLSAVFLAVPAYYINHYAALASRVTLTRIRLEDPALRARHSQLLERLQTLRDGWRPWKAWCLHIGTAAALLAAALTAIASVREL